MTRRWLPDFRMLPSRTLATPNSLAISGIFAQLRGAIYGCRVIWSGMHHHAKANLDDILWRERSWDGSTAYAESKLHDAMLAFAVAGRWPDVFSNALEPGWVQTKMGGPGAPDDMGQAHLTQAWLASGDDPKANVTSEYFYHLKQMAPNPQTKDVRLQDHLIALCSEISGVSFPS